MFEMESIIIYISNKYYIDIVKKIQSNETNKENWKKLSLC